LTGWAVFSFSSFFSFGPVGIGPRSLPFCQGTPPFLVWHFSSPHEVRPRWLFLVLVFPFPDSPRLLRHLFFPPFLAISLGLPPGVGGGPLFPRRFLVGPSFFLMARSPRNRGNFALSPCAFPLPFLHGFLHQFFRGQEPLSRLFRSRVLSPPRLVLRPFPENRFPPGYFSPFDIWALFFSLFFPPLRGPSRKCLCTPFHPQKLTQSPPFFCQDILPPPWVVFFEVFFFFRKR